MIYDEPSVVEERKDRSGSELLAMILISLLFIYLIGDYFDDLHQADLIRNLQNRTAVLEQKVK